MVGSFGAIKDVFGDQHGQVATLRGTVTSNAKCCIDHRDKS